MGKHKVALLLLAITLVGASLRFYELDWGEGFFFHVDERLYVVRRTLAYLRALYQSGDFNPHMSTYGTLPLYALMAARTLALTFMAMTQGIPFTADYFLADHLALTVLVGRTISAFLSSATVLVLYVIGKLLYNRVVGVLTAALVATTVALIQAAHYYTVDSMLLFFSALAFVPAIRMAQVGDRKSYILAGVCLALALAVKLPALFLVPILGVAHLQNLHGAQPLPQWNLNGFRRILDRRIFYAVGAALATYIVVSPFSVLDFQGLYLARNTELNALRNINLAFTKPLATWTLAYDGLIPYVYEVTTLLFFGLGFALNLTAWLGVVLMLRRRNRSDILLLAWIIPVFLVLGLSRIKTIRYILPLVPLLVVCGAVFLQALWRWGARSRPRAWLSRLMIVVVVGFTLFYAVAFTNMYGQRDSRLQASDWLYANAPPGSVVVLEDELYYTAQLGLPDEGLDRWNRALSDPDRLPSNVHTVRLLFSPYYDANSYELLDDASRSAHIAATIDGADFVVVSERHYHTYSQLEQLRPVEHQYYQDLFDGTLGFRLAVVIDPSPNALGIVFDDDRAELYYKVFDHPKLWIFQRDASSDQDPVEASVAVRSGNGTD